MLIEWADSASNDLLSILRYLTEHSDLWIAEKVSMRIMAIAERLATFPMSGRMGIMQGTRELVIPDLPYYLVYSIDDKVHILRVMHTRQLPDESYLS